MTLNKLYILGITGGMGCGKSLILGYLEKEYKAHLLKLDDISRDLIMPDGKCYRDVIDLFGEKIIKEDGTLDRGLIAKEMFESPALVEKMNSIIHPEVMRCVKEKIASLEMEKAFIVIEAALLIEAGYKEICDEVWYIYASKDTRRARLIKDRGYSKERIERTFDTQLSDEEYRSNSDFVIDNNGDFDFTKKQIDERLKG